MGCSVENPAAGQPLCPCSYTPGWCYAAVLTSFGSSAGLLWTTLNVFHASWAQKAAEMGLCCAVRTLSQQCPHGDSVLFPASFNPQQVKSLTKWLGLGAKSPELQSAASMPASGKRLWPIKNECADSAKAAIVWHLKPRSLQDDSSEAWKGLP